MRTTPLGQEGPAHLPVHTRLLVRDAGPEDSARTVDVLAQTLACSDIARWLYPNANTRGRLIRDRVRTLTADHVPSATVRILEAGRQILGAAVWTMCGSDPGTARRQSAAGAGDPDSYRIRQLEMRLDRRHPLTPHNHLLLIGVSPDHQRQGIGTALLADWHSHADRAAPCYLLAPESLTPLALRFGYRTVGQRVDAALTAPGLRAMWRPTPERESAGE